MNQIYFTSKYKTIITPDISVTQYNNSGADIIVKNTVSQKKIQLTEKELYAQLNRCNTTLISYKTYYKQFPPKDLYTFSTCILGNMRNIMTRKLNAQENNILTKYLSLALKSTKVNELEIWVSSALEKTEENPLKFVRDFKTHIAIQRI